MSSELADSGADGGGKTAVVVATFQGHKLCLKDDTKGSAAACRRSILQTLKAERARYQRMHSETTRLYVQEACTQSCAAIQRLGQAVAAVSDEDMCEPLTLKQTQLCAAPWDLAGYIGSYRVNHSRITADVTNPPPPSSKRPADADADLDEMDDLAEGGAEDLDSPGDDDDAADEE